MSIVIDHQPLPYNACLARRPLTAIDLVVIHCTELPDLAMARVYGERVQHADGSGNCGHYYIDRDGRILSYVEPDRIAHHVRGYNARAVGIELVNRGRYPDWFDSRCQQMDEAYPAPQIEALVALLQLLKQQLPALAYIAGHEDLDTAQVIASNDPGQWVWRKRDPGPQFPWSQLPPSLGLRRMTSEAGDLGIAP